jgi:hypothetical protein
MGKNPGPAGTDMDLLILAGNLCLPDTQGAGIHPANEKDLTPNTFCQGPP